MRIVGSCAICGSDAFLRRGRVQCPNLECLGKSDGEWALIFAHRDYANDSIDVAELERQVERALTNPPQRWRGTVVFG